MHGKDLMNPEAVGAVQDTPERIYAFLKGMVNHKVYLYRKLSDAMDPDVARYIAERYPPQYRSQLSQGNNQWVLRQIAQAEQDWREVFALTRYTVPARLLGPLPSQYSGLPLLEQYTD